MSVNGITSSQVVGAYSYQATEATNATKTNSTNTDTAKAESTQNATDTGVVYDSSVEKATESVKKTYTPDTALINKLKADAEARTAQLRSIVEKLMVGQSNAYNTANDIWSFLREGNYTVDEATRLQAQKDIAEDGYWGVAQTSDRIIDFANALTGGDPNKMEDMREAFKKGFEQAKETWGGELPDISQRTYDAVMEKFDKLVKKANETSNNTPKEYSANTKIAADPTNPF